MKNRSMIFMAILPVLACFAFLPGARAICNEGCGSNFNTFEGENAPISDTTGAANTAFGWFALFANTEGSFNSAVGAGALDLNTTGSDNTATGVAALLLNTAGNDNTAIGTAAMEFNDTGSASTAVGAFALMNQTTTGSNTAVGWSAQLNTNTGFNNAAFGVRAMEFNVDGTNNTALGNLALNSSASTSNHVCVGRLAGQSITTVDNNVIVGHHSGVHSVFGEISDRCFIDNIYGAPVSAATGTLVYVDSDGRLGTFTTAGSDPGGFSPKGGKPHAIPDAAKQAALNLKVEKLEATVVQLTAQLKEQADQIQKVSAQLEMSKPAAKVVVNKP
jgi:hypothetical protein